MDIPAAALLVLAGLTAGLLAGAFGIGGGIVLVPVLLYYLHAAGVSSLVSTHVAMGTSLLVVAFLSAAHAWEFRRTNHVIWRGAFFIALAGVAGAFAGSSIASGLEGSSLRRVFGFVLLVAAVRLLSGKRKQGKEAEPDLSPRLLLGAGLLVGLVSSLSGIGGALVAIPLLSTYLHFPARKAFGTSSAAIAVTALAGAAGYLFRGWESEFLPAGMHGFIDFQAAIPLVAGAVPGAILGTRFAARLDTGSLRKIYAVLLLVVMLRMFFV
ncbi:MAG TPA: sulfite exporter TauE/SafE family protein [Bacteroidota bacterium]|nr:sulfite exporter TauE/SafE family protein [Bacteroidota bacterium]